MSASSMFQLERKKIVFEYMRSFFTYFFQVLAVKTIEFLAAHVVWINLVFFTKSPVHTLAQTTQVAEAIHYVEKLIHAF